jgi:DNA-binding MarR family transcriptional regulator
MLDRMKADAKGRRSSASPAENLEQCADDDIDAHVRWAREAWSEIDPDVEAIVSRVQMAQRRLERAAVDTRDQVGLAHGELKILFRLTRGSLGQGEIAKSLLVSTGTMTNQLDKLEAAGLVVRLGDPNDRRGKVVEMTAQGRATLDRYVNVQARRERQLLDRLSADDKQQLNDLLRKLLASLADQSRPPTP